MGEGGPHTPYPTIVSYVEEGFETGSYTLEPPLPCNCVVQAGLLHRLLSAEVMATSHHTHT